ncbi:MAG TPA: dethiobiotin synthase, partial [Verrucomicrobiae bacterium]|nr:dethiobiotin synthase [Verrucomicrobiae bacterium]
GKTVMTALLLAALRQTGRPALALKPFCSGGRGDAELLHELQKEAASLDDVNPFYFPQAIAPLEAARVARRRVTTDDVLCNIYEIGGRWLGQLQRETESGQPCCLIEGAGGLLSPLGVFPARFRRDSSDPNEAVFTSLDLIAAMDASVVLVAANRLGTLNHTLLSLQALRLAEVHRVVVVLAETAPPSNDDPSRNSNLKLLRKMAEPRRVLSLPYLGDIPENLSPRTRAARIHAAAKKYRARLRRLMKELRTAERSRGRSPH